MQLPNSNSLKSSQRDRPLDPAFPSTHLHHQIAAPPTHTLYQQHTSSMWPQVLSTPVVPPQVSTKSNNLVFYPVTAVYKTYGE